MKATLRLLMLGTLILSTTASWAQSGTYPPATSRRSQFEEWAPRYAPPQNAPQNAPQTYAAPQNGAWQPVGEGAADRDLSEKIREVLESHTAAGRQLAPAPIPAQPAQPLYRSAQLPNQYGQEISDPIGYDPVGQPVDGVDWGYPNAIPGEPAHFYKPAKSNWADEYGVGTWGGVADGPRVDFRYFDGLGCDDWACFCKCRTPFPLSCRYLFAGRGKFDPDCGVYRGKHGCGRPGCESCGGQAGKYPACTDGSCGAHHCHRCHGKRGHHCHQCNQGSCGCETASADGWQANQSNQGILNDSRFRDFWR